jgi:alpha-beta hydrolase superfamily lysophospholipase
LVVWGYSVGTALAVEFAKDKDFDALILFSPLASRYDMSQKVFGFPVQKLFFLPNTYVSKKTIQSISEPTLIIHGNDDTVVPFWQ